MKLKIKLAWWYRLFSPIFLGFFIASYRLNLISYIDAMSAYQKLLNKAIRIEVE